MSYKFSSILVGLGSVLSAWSSSAGQLNSEPRMFHGIFTELSCAVDSVLTASRDSSQINYQDSVKDMMHRVRLDFSLNESQVREQLDLNFDHPSDSVIAAWEKSGLLEMRYIDGEKRYFKNAVANLRRLLNFQETLKTGQQSACNAKNESLDVFCLEHTARIVAASKGFGETVEPQSLKISYRLTVKADAVPDGELIRCWLPAPREGHARQTGFQLLSGDSVELLLAPNTHMQRTFYLEKKAVKGVPTCFEVSYKIQTAAQHFDLKPEMIKPYDTNTSTYRHYTREQAPQLVFTPQVKALAQQIVGGETNPLRKVEKIYRWINDSIPWASALEYSIMPDIPAYVLEHRHGDCGMQTLLFMSLARSQGIPVKWQSGFMLHPDNVNLHDWCEVYYEGIGWVPVDQSFKLQNSEDPKLRDFYMHGIDAYRLIVNDDFAQELMPAKKYFRSEPIDFQRGEVEWSGGNLYFDQWSWDIDVE